jgi:23S rRNA (adenine2503-C2)-methyltransferase
LLRGIERLGKDFGGKIGLAVSLHAPNDELRSQIIPINRRYPLSQLMGTLRRYPLPRRRRITIEYTLIGGFNDGFEHARQLGQILRGLPVKINLIPMNPVQGSDLQASSSERVADFQDYLARDGYSCFIRTRRGDDVAAACGQLAFHSEATLSTD